MIKRRLFSAGLLVAPFAKPAFAQNAQSPWQPTAPVKMVVAYPAGGPTDVIARIVAADIAGSLGQQVVVENLSGGAGAIGTRAVAKAKPDGHTITFGNNQTHGNNMFMLKEPGYDAV
jgi:tripartite-type tricarboxylate transporter receptor subunit TctC